MQAKDASVNVRDLHPVVTAALPQMEACRLAALTVLLTTEAVLTSGKDGQHKNGSLHYQGLAVDLRIRDFADQWVQYLKQSLGSGWDVVLEADHIHIERDPKKKPV